MRKLLCCALVLALLSLTACEREYDAYSTLSEFVSLYSLDGVIYSPATPEGEVGHIPDGLVEKIFAFHESVPKEYAIFLNSRPDYGSECAVFISESRAEVAEVYEMCLERVRILDPTGERGFVGSSDRLVFYSTVSDRARAEEIFKQIIK